MPYHDFRHNFRDRDSFRRNSRGGRHDERVNEKEVPESRHAIFFRGLGPEIPSDRIKEHFQEEIGPCIIDFYKSTPERAFVAVRFDAKEDAAKCMEKYQEGKLFGYDLEVTWYKDIRRYVAHVKGGRNDRHDGPFRRRDGGRRSRSRRSSRDGSDSEDENRRKRKRRESSSSSSSSRSSRRSRQSSRPGSPSQTAKPEPDVISPVKPTESKRADDSMEISGISDNEEKDSELDRGLRVAEEVSILRPNRSDVSFPSALKSLMKKKGICKSTDTLSGVSVSSGGTGQFTVSSGQVIQHQHDNASSTSSIYNPYSSASRGHEADPSSDSAKSNTSMKVCPSVGPASNSSNDMDNIGVNQPLSENKPGSNANQDSDDHLEGVDDELKILFERISRKDPSQIKVKIEPKDDVPQTKEEPKVTRTFENCADDFVKESHQEPGKTKFTIFYKKWDDEDKMPRWQRNSTRPAFEKPSRPKRVDPFVPQPETSKADNADSFKSQQSSWKGDRNMSHSGYRSEEKRSVLEFKSPKRPISELRWSNDQRGGRRSDTMSQNFNVSSSFGAVDSSVTVEASKNHHSSAWDDWGCVDPNKESDKEKQEEVEEKVEESNEEDTRRRPQVKVIRKQRGGRRENYEKYEKASSPGKENVLTWRNSALKEYGDAPYGRHYNDHGKEEKRRDSRERNQESLSSSVPERSQRVSRGNHDEHDSSGSRTIESRKSALSQSSKQEGRAYSKQVETVRSPTPDKRVKVHEEPDSHCTVQQSQNEDPRLRSAYYRSIPEMRKIRQFYESGDVFRDKPYSDTTYDPVTHWGPITRGYREGMGDVQPPHGVRHRWRMSFENSQKYFESVDPSALKPRVVERADDQDSDYFPIKANLNRSKYSGSESLSQKSFFDETGSQNSEATGPTSMESHSENTEFDKPVEEKREVREVREVRESRPEPEFRSIRQIAVERCPSVTEEPPPAATTDTMTLIRRQTIQEIRHEPQKKSPSNGLQLSNLATKPEEILRSKLAKFPNEFKSSVELKRKELEAVFRKDCQTFGLVAKKLVDKSPDLEKPLKLAMLGVLSDLEKETNETLLKYVEELEVLFDA